MHNLEKLQQDLLRNKIKEKSEAAEEIFKLTIEFKQNSKIQ